MFKYSGFLKVAVNAAVCIIIPNVINVVVFYRTDEFKYLVSIAKSFLTKLTNKK